jgi:hypothetical protein
MKHPILRTLTVVGLSAVCVGSLDLWALAQTSERRTGSPDYLHIRSDLYKTETLMRAPALPNVKREENGAVGYIADAIRQVNKAARLEDADTGFAPAPNMSSGDRLKEAEHTLDAAWSELKAPESDWHALPARANAIEDVREAQTRVLRAEAAEREDHAH